MNKQFLKTTTPPSNTYIDPEFRHMLLISVRELMDAIKQDAFTDTITGVKGNANSFEEMNSNCTKWLDSHYETVSASVGLVSEVLTMITSSIELDDRMN